MIYYAVIYLKNGEIHSKPWSTKADAEQCIEDTSKKPEFANQIDKTKVVKKDPNSPWYQSVNGYWI